MLYLHIVEAHGVRLRPVSLNLRRQGMKPTAANCLNHDLQDFRIEG